MVIMWAMQLSCDELCDCDIFTMRSSKLLHVAVAHSIRIHQSCPLKRTASQIFTEHYDMYMHNNFHVVTYFGCMFLSMTHFHEWNVKSHS